ncbi:MAG: acyltransferase, partial [Deltaproteobacteria bacterium]|nr:acyltransferase [Deltaproteobacteria bacterium]
RLRAAGPWLLAFAKRRAWRLWPLAWGTAGLAWLFAVALGGEFGTGTQLAREAVAVVTCTYNLFALEHAGERLAWYWSLGVEEQFYAALPLLLLLTGTRRWHLVLAASGVLLPVLLRPWEVPSAPGAFESWRYPPWARADALLSGVLLAAWQHGRSPAARRRLGMVGPVSWGLAVAVFLLPATGPFGWALGGGATLLTLLSFLLVALASRNAGDVLPGAAGLLEWLGARSYALYLLHPLALRAVLRLDLPASGTLAAFTALSLAAAALAHRYVERPLLHRGAPANPLGQARGA